MTYIQYSDTALKMEETNLSANFSITTQMLKSTGEFTVSESICKLLNPSHVSVVDHWKGTNNQLEILLTDAIVQQCNNLKHTIFTAPILKLLRIGLSLVVQWYYSPWKGWKFLLQPEAALSYLSDMKYDSPCFIVLCKKKLKVVYMTVSVVTISCCLLLVVSVLCLWEEK